MFSNSCGSSFLGVWRYSNPPPMDLRSIFPQSLLRCSIPNHHLARTKLRFQSQSHLRQLLLPPAASIPRFVRIGTPALTPRTLVRKCCADDQSTSSEDIHTRAEISGLQVDTKFDLPSLWNQMKQIALFAGPVIGMWICSPLMSLIDTIVIGKTSTMELAALGPGTVVSDYLGYLFMFLSIATSNMVATSLAKKDKDLAQHQISVLMFIALSCGVGMFLLTKFLGTSMLSGFVGLKNSHLIPAASTYIQIRSFAWPAFLVGMVCQSASLGMKNSWGPLKALVVATAVNCIGDIILCSFFGYGIAGAAWATMVSQIVAAFMMIQTLNKAGFIAFSQYVPSAVELFQIIKLAAPVFLITTSKVFFYSVLTYFTTAMGTITIASHQVIINLFMICSVWGDPLSQSAQAFMPEMIYGINRSLEKARMLLKSFAVIGFFGGLISGTVATLVVLFFPGIFTTDNLIVKKMHKTLLPLFMALVITPSTLAFEGTLLSGRELGFLSLSMTGCFGLCVLLLMFICNRGGGLTGCWCVLAFFQWARFSMALLRLTSPQGMLYSEEFYKNKHLKV